MSSAFCGLRLKFAASAASSAVILRFAGNFTTNCMTMGMASV